MDELPTITNDVAAADIREQLGHLCHTARRCIPKVGNVKLPTPWDIAHVRINAALDHLEAIDGL